MDLNIVRSMKKLPVCLLPAGFLQVKGDVRRLQRFACVVSGRRVFEDSHRPSGEWPVTRGGVGHLPEFVTAGTARCLYGDAVGEGGDDDSVASLVPLEQMTVGAGPFSGDSMPTLRGWAVWMP
ncbi:hypothetical protein [Streptomyces marokkonensis]|uniref:hypothetical protein n=1 Tax=Streptomyces marokkonensis TaxID=324855 RepID=UPI001AD77671|nr:hypothetical protein [Streptomyces marokkonensis]